MNCRGCTCSSSTVKFVVTVFVLFLSSTSTTTTTTTTTTTSSASTDKNNECAKEARTTSIFTYAVSYTSYTAFIPLVERNHGNNLSILSAAHGSATNNYSHSNHPWNYNYKSTTTNKSSSSTSAISTSSISSSSIKSSSTTQCYYQSPRSNTEILPSEVPFRNQTFDTFDDFDDLNYNTGYARIALFQDNHDFNGSTSTSTSSSSVINGNINGAHGNVNGRSNSLSNKSTKYTTTAHNDTMFSSIKNALNQKLTQNNQLRKSSSRKYAISPQYYNHSKYINGDGSSRNSSSRNSRNSSGYHKRINGSSATYVKSIDSSWKKQSKKETVPLKNNNNNSNNSNNKKEQNTKQSRKQIAFAIRNLWKKRNARSIEEGIRRGIIDSTSLRSSGSSNSLMNSSLGVIHKKKDQQKNKEKNYWRITSWFNNKNNNNNKKKKEELKVMDNEDRKEKLSFLLQDDNFYALDDGENDNYINSSYSFSPNNKNQNDNNSNNSPQKRQSKRYIARTITGLISAVAEEASGLDVKLDMREDTPLWQKHVDKLSIQFERLGVKQLKMGGLDEALQEMNQELQASLLSSSSDSEDTKDDDDKNDNDDEVLSVMSSKMKHTPDEIFDQIDLDNSGALDEEELTKALTIASAPPSGTIPRQEKFMTALGRLAKRLIILYDTNGDGVVDRDEYKKLVEDMTAVRDDQRLKLKEREKRRRLREVKRKGRLNPLRWGRVARRAFFRMKNDVSSSSSTTATTGNLNGDYNDDVVDDERIGLDDKSQNASLNGALNRSSQLQDSTNRSPAAITSTVNGSNGKENGTLESSSINFDHAEDVPRDLKVLNAMTKGEGSIVLEDLKLDLRRLVFGAVPVVKKVSIDHTSIVVAVSRSFFFHDQDKSGLRFFVPSKLLSSLFSN